MTQPTRTDKQAQAHQRQARLEAELRANLKKRKQQARDRDAAGDEAAGDAGDRQGPH
jgi:hypothetical protein